MQQQHGSGKTAVLVERIINKVLNEKINIDEILVVTFTNAAASEMRERVLDAIYKKLDEEPENENLQKQITLLNKASICTIDSFCLEVVRNYFYELENISPNFRIADTSEIELLKQEVIDDIFEEKYEKEDEDFTKLINIYTSYRDDTPLKDLVLKIYSYIQSNPFPEKWLNEKIEMFNLEDKLEEDFSNTIWGKELLKEVKEIIIDSITSLNRIEKHLSVEPELEKFWQTIRTDIEQLETLKEHTNSWDDAYTIANNLEFVTWPRKSSNLEIKEKAKEVRDEVKEKIKNISKKILICNSKEANQDIYDMYLVLKKLENLILEFQTEFSKRKRDKNIVDFHNIEHFALKILLKTDEEGHIEKSEIAKKYQNKFKEVAIDEYQDSNLVQEYILTAVSNNKNIFMVGDVKQSIYKFRQAMPELFLSKYDTYKKKEEKGENDDLKIQLFKNFRSKKNVLDFTNIIFQDIMSNQLGDILYDKEEYLNLGANYPEINQNQKTEIHIIQTKEQENEIFNELEEKNKEEQINKDENNEEVEEHIEDIELEARFVANKIKELIKNKFQIYDRKKEKYRDIEYKDAVILLRATSKSAPIFEQELLNLGLPVFSDSSQEYLDSIEIQTIMSLLKIIDNPIQDIPLVTVLRSPIGKFTDDELIQIRLSDKKDDFYTCMQKAKISVNSELSNKIEQFLNNLDNWRKEQEYLALDELIWKIYSDTGYYNYVSLMPNGMLRQANLRMLFERAKQYETASFKGLYNFIHFIEKIHLSSGDLGAAKIIGENENVVRIMSIHKSKGLEFPVVFLSSTGKQFNLMDLNESILLHQEMGIGVKYIDYEKQIQYDTLSKAAIRNKILTETLSEEMRILYVALTRAKEKLYITGIQKDYDKVKEKIMGQIEQYPLNDENKINPILLKKYKKYLDWIMLVYMYEKENMTDIAELHIHNKSDLMKSLEKSNDEDVDVIGLLNNHNLSDSSVKFENIEDIQNVIESKYKYEESIAIQTKTSVTELKELANLNNEANKKIKHVLNYERNTDEGTIVEGNIESSYEKFQIPNFMKNEEQEKLTGARKGTLLHLCMQKLEIEKDYELSDVKELVNNLKDREIITQLEAENININAILKFTKSNIWEELKNAKEVHREEPFYMTIPAKEIYKKDVEEKILVQGVIDLYYIDKNNNLVLLDYKTDYLENGAEELIQKYDSQLQLYKKALEDALNRKVDKIYIYSTYLGKEIKI